MDVILAILDDVSRQDFEAIPTPNIDARSETEFTRFYSMPACPQTRKALQFSRYRELPNIYDSPDPSWLSMSQSFKDNGWNTGIFGKWNLGESHLSAAYGFDTWQQGRQANIDGPTQNYFNWERWTNDQPDGISNAYAGEADVQALNSWWAVTPSPKFAWLGLPHPHRPLHAPPAHLIPTNPPLQGNRAKWEAMVMAADTLIGQLPMPDIMITCSDNGTPMVVGGQKTEVTELGVNAVLRTCGFHPPGTTDALIHAVDVLPTLAGLLSFQKPPQSQLDEVDGVPIGPQWKPRVSLYVGHDKPGGPRRQAAISRRWKLVRIDGVERLYDLLSDPTETMPLDPASGPQAWVDGLRDLIDEQG